MDAGCGRGPGDAAPPAVRPAASSSSVPSNAAAPAAASSPTPAAPELPEEFLSLMNVGKNLLEQGDPKQALETYRKAAALVPNDVDVRLNIAIALLAADASAEAVRAADEVLRLAPNTAAGWFVKGSAQLRLGDAREAVKSLENARQIDPSETATCFQLGRARVELQQWAEAVNVLREGLAMDPNHLHAPVHYLLGQSLTRLGRTDEARQELEQHQAAREADSRTATAATFERGKFTLPRVPFRLDQPDPDGVPFTLVDATATVLGPSAGEVAGPVGVIDPGHTGTNSLFVLGADRSFHLLVPSNGVFVARGPSLPARPQVRFGAVLVGDLDNDRWEDVIVLGDPGSQVFRFGPNGTIGDVSRTSRLEGLAAVDGLLLDLDFTGKLDLVAVGAVSNALRVFRQSGPLLFGEITEATGIPAGIPGLRAVGMEDWNQDGTTDLVVGRDASVPLLLEKQRGGKLASRVPTNWVAGGVLCTGDFDNDLRADLAVVSEGRLVISFEGGARREFPAPGAAGFRKLSALDVDNDGWLDLVAVGDSIRVWRNAGAKGFQDITARVGLGDWHGGTVSALVAADFDGDCDLDWVLTRADGGLRYLRNDGANANGLLKVQLSGNRSNASGLGCKVEIATRGLRLLRTIQRLPVEVGVGRHDTLDSFLIHWFNWPQGSVDTPVNCQEPILAVEAILQEGSCPYLYAWDGTRFRFVTDILGASPLGLPVAEGRYLDADPEELVRLGDERTFVPRDGRFEIAITEELREVLYLDEAKLVVVDHEPGVEVHATDKLLPAPPFPPGELRTLDREHPLRQALAEDGREVTDALRAEDGVRVSPPRLRVPQLRGLAEPHALTLDFGPLDPARPLVLVLNGWLRFGGGMANIAASQDPALPFPFPTLEAETSPGTWQPIDVVVGAPAGKTKTILVDLTGKLPPSTRRLRLREAFEIHWDRIALMESREKPATRITRIAPAFADLRFHGFGRLETRPADCPPTPSYTDADPVSRWTVIPGGWCTRYGDVRELVAARDEGLVLVNSGDELRLGFAADALPEKPPGAVREFFLYVDGWDKDSDFHVATGTEVEPLPFHGMNAQEYRHQTRPAFPSDALHRQYNSRWVDPRALKRIAGR